MKGSAAISASGCGEPARDNPGRARRGSRGQVITLPAIRRALQRLLAPISRCDCTYCRPWIGRSR